MIREHRLRHSMPIRRVQRRVSRPADRIRVARAVFELVDRAVGAAVERWEGGDVAVEGVGVVDAEVAGVDFVHPVAGVEVCEGCDGGADPADGEGVFAGLDGAVIGVLGFPISNGVELMPGSGLT